MSAPGALGVVTASLLPEKPARRNGEELLARSVAQYLRFALPDEATFTHIPLGGMRHPKAAAKLSGMGTKAGWPDYIIVHRGRALFVELKTERGYTSRVQRQMAQKLVRCGCPVMVCRSLPEVEAGLRDAGVPLRASCT